MDLSSENKQQGWRGGSLDYNLILATVGVLFAISVISVYGMFYFKFAAIQQLPVPEKIAYMNTMNRVVVPFIIALILLLGVCVPKRLLPARPLGQVVAVLGLACGGFSLWQGVRFGLMVVLVASLVLQLVVLALALAGNRRLRFTRSGYWIRVGSSLIHLGLILFILDLLLYRYRSLHLLLFWVTTGTSVLGMLCCFYSRSLAVVVRRIRASAVK